MSNHSYTYISRYNRDDYADSKYSFSLTQYPDNPLPIRGNCSAEATWRSHYNERARQWEYPFSFKLTWDSIRSSERICWGSNLHLSEHLGLESIVNRNQVRAGSTRCFRVEIPETTMSGHGEFVHAGLESVGTSGPCAFIVCLCLASPSKKPPLPDLTLPWKLRDLISTSHANDVEFFFPAEDVTLWANSTALKASSPYYKMLLESDFAEGASTPVLTATLQSSLGSESALGSIELLEDSDGDESSSGDTQGERHPAPSTTPSDPSCPFPIHKITVTSSKARTYAAVLTWIYSRTISFARLQSLAESQPPSYETISTDTSTVSAVSPKSIYRLAHFLEIEPLKDLAFDSFASQLTIDNVAEEMFSELSGSYEEIRTFVVDFVFQNWGAVKDTVGWKRMKAENREGKRPHAGQVYAELMDKFEQLSLSLK